MNFPWNLPHMNQCDWTLNDLLESGSMITESEFTQTGSTLVDQHFYHLCQKNPQFHDLTNRRLIDRMPNRILTSQNVNVKFIK